MKKAYLATTIEKDGKRYSYIVSVNNRDNLLSVLGRIKGIEHANIYLTKKEAVKTVQFWNECYKNNGTYMFSETFA